MTIADPPRPDAAAAHAGAEGRASRPVARRFLARLAGPAGAGIILSAMLAVFTGVMAGWFDSLNVVHGAPLWVPVGVAVACLLVGSAGRSAGWWRTWGAGLVVATTTVVAVAHWWVGWSGLVIDRYPNRFVVFVWLAVAGIGVALTGWWHGPVAVRAVRVLAAPTSVLAAFLLINSYYGYWPTVATLLNRPVAGQVSKQALAQLLGPPALPLRAETHGLLTASSPVSTPVTTVSPASPATAATTATTGPEPAPQIPDGRYGPVDLPGTAVGFAAAQAYLWLPPDFATVPHTGLPVIVMLPGWPGNVQDWTRAGRVTDLANAWARAHGGRAPVILLIDENGASGRDTECVDSAEGRAESYLTTSVPAFLEQTLGISPDPRRWALVGYSEGGTCAITLALRHPGIYGRFVDIAGDPAPNFQGGPAVTLRVLYGGSMADENQHTPSWLLQHDRYPGTIGWFSTGSYDGLRARNAQLAALAADAGMNVHVFNLAGRHTWTFAGEAFTSIYPYLVESLSVAGTAGPPAA